MPPADRWNEEQQVTRFLNAWFSVRQVIQAANFNHFHQAGLSATQFMTLNLLPPGEGSIAIGELAKNMNLKAATVAKTVDSLEARGLLARTRGTSDRRNVFVSITESGRLLQNAAMGQFRAHIVKIFSAMPPEHRTALIQGLESLVHVAGTIASPAGTTQAARDAVPEERSSRGSRRP